MFQRSKGKTMKWVSLLKDIKEKVGLAQSPTATSTATTVSSSSSSSNRDAYASSTRYDYVSSPSRDKHELELDFKRFWEEFCSSNSEKEKEAALNLTVDAFCRLVKQHANVAQLVTLLPLESLARMNKKDSWLFWWTLYLSAVAWIVLGIFSLIRFQADYLLVVGVCLTLNIANIVGFTKCRKDAKKQIQQFASQTIASRVSSTLQSAFSVV